MHAFHWTPAEQQRHASLDTKPANGNYPTGMCIETLCGRQLPADNSERAWLWPTCPDCNAEARRIASTEPQEPVLELDLRAFLLRRAGR